jgi:Na(+)/H(+) exchange regulatory cofactor NHE-RF2
MDNLPDDAPSPRLCHLLKWPDFDGYGFNLHGEKTKPGQYIGKVDKDSPAEAAGMKGKDRIVEVNGTNISNENHKQVVLRIKAIPNETKLLVLDEKAEEYYKARNIVVTSAMPNVIYAKTPVPRPVDYGGSPVNNAPDSMSSVTESNGGTESPVEPEGNIHHQHHSDEDGASHASDSGSVGSSLPSKTNSLKKESRNGFSMDDDSMGPSPTPPGSTASPSPTPILMSSGSTKGSNSSLDLNMTAQEMRAKLAARKKFDPKNQKMDLRKKYEIIQTL